MHGRPHIWANGVSWPPWKNGWKIKKRKHAKKSSFLNGGWGWSDTSDDWLVKLMIIVIIIDHYPYSRVSLFLYILRRSPNSVSYPRSLLSVAKFDDWVSVFSDPLYWCGAAGTGVIYLPQIYRRIIHSFRENQNHLVFRFIEFPFYWFSHLRTEEFFLCSN